jgi:hypothetical protein
MEVLLDDNQRLCMRLVDRPTYEDIKVARITAQTAEDAIEGRLDEEEQKDDLKGSKARSESGPLNGLSPSKVSIESSSNEIKPAILRNFKKEKQKLQKMHLHNSNAFLNPDFNINDLKEKVTKYAV